MEILIDLIYAVKPYISTLLIAIGAALGKMFDYLPKIIHFIKSHV